MTREQHDPFALTASILAKAAAVLALVAAVMILTRPAEAGSGWSNPNGHHQTVQVQRFWHDHGGGYGHWHVRKVHTGHGHHKKHGHHHKKHHHNGHGHQNGHGHHNNKIVGHWHNGQWHKHAGWTQGHRHNHGHRHQNHRSGFFVFFGN